MPFLTDDLIWQLPAPATSPTITFDKDPPEAPGAAVIGLGIRVTAAGTKSFVLAFRFEGSRRTYTIGKFPRWKTERARKEARRLREEIDSGIDVQAEKDSKRHAPTVNELFDRFEKEHLPKRRASTAEGYRRIIRLHIRRAIGNKKVATVTIADADAVHREITAKGHRHQANRTIAVAQKAFALALRWGLRTDGVNPFRGVERHRELPRRRYLSADEVQRLASAMAKHPDDQSGRAIKLLLWTGARRGEVLAARWADIDLDDGTWSRHADSLKGGRHHQLPLSPPACALLATMRDEQSGRGRRPLGEFVFTSSAVAGHLRQVQKTWRSLCKAAGIKDARLHDLRHTHASILASGGASLPLIGSLLGHVTPSATQRYSHLSLDPQRRAVEGVASALNLDGTGTAAEVVPIKRGR